MKYLAVIVLVAVMIAAMVIPHYVLSATDINPTKVYHFALTSTTGAWADQRSTATANTLTEDPNPAMISVQNYNHSNSNWGGITRSVLKFHVGQAWGTITSAKLSIYVTAVRNDDLGYWHPYAVVARKDISGTVTTANVDDILTGASLVSSGSGLSFGLMATDAYNDITLNISALTQTPPDANGDVFLWLINSYDWSNTTPHVPAAGTWNDMDLSYSNSGNPVKLTLSTSTPPTATTTTPATTTPPPDVGDIKLKCDKPYDITYNQAKIRVTLLTLGSHASADIDFEISPDAENWTPAALGTGITEAPQNWTVTATDLDSPKTYYYRATADDNGSIFYSAQYQFTTPDKSKPALIQGMDTWLSNIGLGSGAWWLVFFVLNLIVWWKLWDHKAIAIIVSCLSFAGMVAFGLVSPWILILLLILAGGAIYTRIFRPGSE